MLEMIIWVCVISCSSGHYEPWNLYVIDQSKINCSGQLVDGCTNPALKKIFITNFALNPVLSDGSKSKIRLHDFYGNSILFHEIHNAMCSCESKT